MRIMKFKLQEIRKSKGYSQNDLARLCDMSVNNIQKYEAGKMKSYPHSTLESFCRILQCEPGELLVMENVEV